VAAVTGSTERAAPRARVPLLLGTPALVAVLFLLLPLAGLLLRAPWRGLPHLLAEPEVREALRLSLLTATLATGLSLLFGVPLAWVLARSAGPAVRLLRALVTLPLVLPPVVGGVALLLALGRRGFVGRHLDAWFGLTLPFTTAGVVIAETFVAMPFLVVTVEGALRSADHGLEEAAATLGSSPFGTFRRNAPGVTETMPLAVYLALERDPDAAIALSLVLLLVSITVLTLLRERWLGQAG
jgi:molybdate transport system permease protein